MIVTIYYLIPGLRELFSFPLFLAGSGILLVGGGWVLGKILVKRPATRDVTKFSPPGEIKDGRATRQYDNARPLLLMNQQHRLDRPLVTVFRGQSTLDVYLLDGTYELFRHFYALPPQANSAGE